MKVRFFVHLIPVTPQEIPEGSFPEGMPECFKHMVSFKPGTPVIKSKLVEVPDDLPVKLHGGLIIPITENHPLQVSMVKWDRLETRGPQIKVIFNGHISTTNLASLLQEMKEDGGWEDGCSCRDCREKRDFTEMMRGMMGADPENN